MKFVLNMENFSCKTIFNCVFDVNVWVYTEEKSVMIEFEREIVVRIKVFEVIFKERILCENVNLHGMYLSVCILYDWWVLIYYHSYDL